MKKFLFLMPLLLLTGCGSGGSVTGNTGDPGSGPEPVPTRATVSIGTQAASAETVIYGVQLVVHLPAGVTVSADPVTGEPLPGVLQSADSGMLAGARYRPATTTARGSVQVVIADAGGFAVGNLATLTCVVAPGATASPAGFTLEGFTASDPNGVAMPGITARLSVQTQ